MPAPLAAQNARPAGSKNARPAGSKGVRRSMLGLAVLLQMIAGCAIATPFRTVDRAAAPAEADTVIFAITEATLSPDRSAHPAFWEGVRSVVGALPENEGLIGYSIRQEPLGDRVWTMTSWEDADSLAAFVASDVHRRAIETVAPALADARFARVERSATLPPLTWEEALAALEIGCQGYEPGVAGQAAYGTPQSE